MMTIVNGELPEKPADGDGSETFNTLWKLCRMCWVRVCAALPTAQYIADHLGHICELEVY